MHVTGDNDDLLEWPFQGRLCITVLNQATDRLLRENYTETIVTKDHLRAYDQPIPGSSSSSSSSSSSTIRNVNGFGIHEFVRVNGLYSGGFVGQNNTLAIKAQYEPL